MTLPNDPDSTDLLRGLRHAMHELNNALTPVLANAQLARVTVDTDPAETKEALDDVVEAAARANALVAEMGGIVRDLQDKLATE